MKLAILGYGKMGKAIESIALERNHEVVLTVGGSNLHELTAENIAEADVAIEFSKPESALNNLLVCFKAKTAVVIGTTGWYDDYQTVLDACTKSNGAFLAATNFSLGVNILFDLNKRLAAIMSKHSSYQVKISEIHHTEKLDSPSGTAISLAEGIIEQHAAYERWINENTEEEKELGIISYREEEVPGTHEIIYNSSVDQISLKHEAKNRKGFALGALLAAEFIQGKQGVFSMQDVLNQ